MLFSIGAVERSIFFAFFDMFQYCVPNTLGCSMRMFLYVWKVILKVDKSSKPSKSLSLFYK